MLNQAVMTHIPTTADTSDDPILPAVCSLSRDSWLFRSLGILVYFYQVVFLVAYLIHCYIRL